MKPVLILLVLLVPALAKALVIVDDRLRAEFTPDQFSLYSSGNLILPDDVEFVYDSLSLLSDATVPGFLAQLAWSFDLPYEQLETEWDLVLAAEETITMPADVIIRTDGGLTFLTASGDEDSVIFELGEFDPQAPPPGSGITVGTSQQGDAIGTNRPISVTPITEEFLEDLLSANPPAIPEPSALSLLGLGVISSLLAYRRRS